MSVSQDCDVCGVTYNEKNGHTCHVEDLKLRVEELHEQLEASDDNVETAHEHIKRLVTRLDYLLNNKKVVDVPEPSMAMLFVDLNDAKKAIDWADDTEASG